MTETTITRFPSLAEAREQFCAEVDRMAGEVRQLHLTVIPGQAETYQAKAIDAERYLADPTADCPFVAVEAAAAGLTLEAAARAILERRDEWLRVAAAIERVRIGAKAAIRAAQTPREMHEAVQLAHEALAELRPRT